MLVNVKLNDSWTKETSFKFANFIGLLFLNDMAKTKLAILPFFCCGGIVKNSVNKIKLEI